MTDLCHNLAKGCKAFRFFDLVLKGLGLGQIADDAGEIEFAPLLRYREGNVGGKRISIFPGGDNLRVLANTFRDPCLYEAVDRRMMITTSAGRHDYVKVMTYNLISTVPKDLFCRLVEEYDLLVFIYGDKGLVGIFNGNFEDGQHPIFIMVIIHILSHNHEGDFLWPNPPFQTGLWLPRR